MLIQCRVCGRTRQRPHPGRACRCGANWWKARPLLNSGRGK